MKVFGFKTAPPIERRKKMTVSMYNKHECNSTLEDSVECDTIKFHSVPGRQRLSLFCLPLIHSPLFPKPLSLYNPWIKMFGFQPSSIPLLIKLMEAGYIILIPFVTMNRQALQTAAILYVCISYFALFLPIKVFVLFYLIKHRQGKQISTVSSYSFTALTLWFSGRLSSWSKEKLADPQTGEVAADCRESTGQFKRSVNQMRWHSVKCRADQRGNDKSLMQESIPQCTCHRGFCGLRPFFPLVRHNIHPSSLRLSLRHYNCM